MKTCFLATLATYALSRADAGNTIGPRGVVLASRSQDSAPTNLRRRPAVPHDEEEEKPWQVQQEVERIMKRLNRLGSATGAETSAVSKELERLETELAAVNPDGTRRNGVDQGLGEEISAVRASLCSQQDLAKDKSLNCDVFMKNVCVSQGNSTEAKISKTELKSTAAAKAAACHNFYLARSTMKIKDLRKVYKRAQKAEKEEPTEEEEKEEPTEEEEKKEPKEEAGGKTEDSSVGSKQDGPSVLNGKKEGPLPSQGYNEYDNASGLVDHNDMETRTSDWLKEHGEDSGLRDVTAICKDHPDSEWCRIHMYAEGKSDSIRTCGHPASVAIALVVALSWAAKP